MRQRNSFSSDALALRDRLAAQGFDCQAGLASPERGFRCRGSLAGYSQPVNFFLPANFANRAGFQLAYHFHGWWTEPAFDPFDPAHGDFGSYLKAARANVILVVPESLGKNDTYNRDLDSAPKAATFFSAVEEVLQRAGVAAAEAPLLLSGHSGAYVLLGHLGEWTLNGDLPRLKAVRGLALFDSAYGYRRGLVGFLSVLRANGSGAYFSAFNPADGSSGKRDTNRRIRRELGEPQLVHGRPDIVFIEDSGLRHMDFMKKYMSTFFASAGRKMDAAKGRQAGAD